MKLTLSSVFQGLLSLFSCLKVRQLHFLLCHGACSITEATNAPSHLERNLQRIFCSCSTILQLSAIFWQIFKFKFKRVTVSSRSETQQLGGTNPLQTQDGRSCFLSVYFIGLGFACVTFTRLFLSSRCITQLSAPSIALFITTCFSSRSRPGVPKTALSLPRCQSFVCV